MNQRDPQHLRLRRVTQTIADISHKPWGSLRILDLGSLEGHFAIEFAMKGAHVIAIEGRETNNAKARAAANALGVTNVEFVTDDVRNLMEERYGTFDVVLCSAILYHLPGEDGCRLIETIAELCSKLVIVDTVIGMKDWRVSNGKAGTTTGSYSMSIRTLTPWRRGWNAPGHRSTTTLVWMTKPSLLNLLRDVGFTTVSEVLRPASFFDNCDRVTLAAINGVPQEISRCREAPEPDWPEQLDLPVNPGQAHYFAPSTPLWKRVGRSVRRVMSRYSATRGT